MDHGATTRRVPRVFQWSILVLMLGALESWPQDSRQAGPPFFLGVWVGADAFAWGDLKGMGKDSASTIQAICKDLADIGCNVVWVSGFAPFFAEKPLMKTWLDTAQKHGLRVVLQGSGFPYCIPKGEEEVLARTRQEVIPFWEDIARTYRAHPALLAYCPVEEIGDNVELGEAPTVEALAEVGQAVAKVDPEHPVVTIHIAAWINVARKEVELRQRRLGILIADLYVFTHVHEWSDPNSAWKTAEDATKGFLDWTQQYAALAASARVPLWMFGQANETIWTRKLNGRLESKKNFKMPGEVEMRFQVWAALLSGAKGLLLFPYTSNPQPPEETRATLEEWEYGIGMRTLEGKPTASHAGLRAVGQKFKQDWPLMGRLEPTGDPIEIDMVVGRRFRDPQDNSGHVMLLNRDLSRARKPSPELLKRFALSFSGELAPGDGVRLEPK